MLFLRWQIEGPKSERVISKSLLRDSSFYSPFPAISRGFTALGEILAYVTVSNPTIEVVTFRLRGWCMLGVFLFV